MKLRTALIGAAFAAGAALLAPGTSYAATDNVTVDAAAFTDNCDKTVNIAIVNLVAGADTSYSINDGPKFTIPTGTVFTRNNVPAVEKDSGRLIVKVEIVSKDTELVDNATGTRVKDKLVHEWSKPAGCTRPTTAATFAGTKTTPPGAPVTYKNCDDVRAHGAAPIYPGQPGWDPKLDRDKDGVGCEPAEGEPGPATSSKTTFSSPAGAAEESLPVTGPGTWTIAAGALALLVVGAGLVLGARRRRAQAEA